MFLFVAGFLTRFRSIDPTDESDKTRQPWTYWAPFAAAAGLIVALNLLPALDDSERLGWRPRPWFRRRWSGS